MQLAHTISTHLEPPALLDSPLMPHFSAQLFASKQREEEESSSQFDRLQLEDYLKVVIVGKGRGIEGKSTEIIRSLNGTWFRQTSGERPASRLYNSLGIRRPKPSPVLRQEGISPQPFLHDFVAPNLFPARKLSPKRTPSRHIPRESSFDSQGFLRAAVMKQIQGQGQGGQETKRRSGARRSCSFYGVREKWGGEEGVVQGKRMIIHE